MTKDEAKQELTAIATEAQHWLQHGTEFQMRQAEMTLLARCAVLKQEFPDLPDLPKPMVETNYN